MLLNTTMCPKKNKTWSSKPKIISFTFPPLHPPDPMLNWWPQADHKFYLETAAGQHWILGGAGGMVDNRIPKCVLTNVFSILLFFVDTLLCSTVRDCTCVRTHSCQFVFKACTFYGRRRPVFKFRQISFQSESDRREILPEFDICRFHWHCGLMQTVPWLCNGVPMK